MKKIIMVFFIFFIFFCSFSWAKTIYVADSLQITMRESPEARAKILRMLSVYEPLEFLGESSNGWLRVRSGSKEGWVLERFTSEEPPKNLQLAELQEKYAILVDKNDKLPELVAENEKLRSGKEEVERQLENLTRQYEMLRNDSADTVGLKTELERLEKENEKLLGGFEKLKMDHNLLKSNVMLYWFLAGAGVFAFAWFMGFILGRIQRRRNPRLY